MKTVWHYGMFDLDNYGDLLFPHIAKFRLKEEHINYQPVSLTGANVSYQDAVKTVSRDVARNVMKSGDVILVGGGNIIHDFPLTFFEDKSLSYKNANGNALWLGAIVDGLTKGCRIGFNAPGGFSPVRRRTLKVWQQLKSHIDYISVRDRSTAIGILKENYIPIVPDPALDKAFDQCVSSGKGNSNIFVEGKILIAIRKRSVNGIGINTVAKILEELCVRLKSTALLIPTSKSHEDQIFLSELVQLGEHFSFYAQPRLLSDVAAAIRCSTLVITSSLHVFITAIHYGVKVCLIKRPGYQKFDGCLEHLGIMEQGYSDWEEINHISAFDDIKGLEIASTDFALNEHWTNILNLISLPNKQPISTNAILDMLRHLSDHESQQLIHG